MEEVISFKVFHKWFYLLCPKRLEKWWEETVERGDGVSERFPYWLEVWPSSIILAKFILKYPYLFKDKVVLDIGCGLGALSLALSHVRAKVISQDIEFDSLRYCKKNFLQNQLPLSLCIQGDWRQISYKKETLDIIVGADIIYERNSHPFLAKFISVTLKKGGACYISSPYRQGSFDFFSKIQEKNLKITRVTHRRIVFNGQRPEIFLWKISKPLSTP